MESNSKDSLRSVTSSTDELQSNHSNKSLRASTSVRPTNLPLLMNASRVNMSYTSIDNIRCTPSPIDTRPRLFQAGSLFDLKTYEEIQSNVYNQKSKLENKGEEDDDTSDGNHQFSNEELYDQTYLNNKREREIQHLTQIVRNDRPVDDHTATIIMQQLNGILQTSNVRLLDSL